MEFDSFCNEVTSFFHGRFQYIQYCAANGTYTAPYSTIAFPTTCILTAFENHYAAEFLGCTDRHRKFDIATRNKRNRSVNEYIQQSDITKTGIIHVGPGTTSFALSKLLLSDTTDHEAALRRIGLKENDDGTHLRQANAKHGTISIDDKNIGLLLQGVTLVNCRPPVARAKNIRLAYIASIDRDVSDLRKDLSYFIKHPDILDGSVLIPNTSTTEAQRLTDFASLFLTPHVRETAIGKLLNASPDIICKALGKASFLSELELEWQDGSGDIAIRPDLLLKRDDGNWDICDLKTAELFEKRLRAGGSTRPRFKEVVLDGCAQLCRYRKYFTIPENAKYAEDLYGVTCTNPNLFLIVGNRDNLTISEIVDCSSMLDPKLTVIEYDSVIDLFAGRI